MHLSYITLKHTFNRTSRIQDPTKPRKYVQQKNLSLKHLKAFFQCLYLIKTDPFDEKCSERPENSNQSLASFQRRFTLKNSASAILMIIKLEIKILKEIAENHRF